MLDGHVSAVNELETITAPDVPERSGLILQSAGPALVTLDALAASAEVS
jgi:hypothetical protein